MDCTGGTGSTYLGLGAGGGGFRVHGTDGNKSSQRGKALTQTHGPEDCALHGGFGGGKPPSLPTSDPHAAPSCRLLAAVETSNLCVLRVKVEEVLVVEEEVVTQVRSYLSQGPPNCTMRQIRTNARSHKCTQFYMSNLETHSKLS